MRIIPRGPVEATIRAPASKSLTVRALAAAALAPGRSTLTRTLVADDPRLMRQALAELGARFSVRDDEVVVDGFGGRPLSPAASLVLDNAGTPLRLLTAICSLGRGRYRLDGSARMRERPVRHLIEALGSLGVRARSVNDDGCPPVEIEAAGFPGGHVTLDGSVSSQFLSALLMTAPCGAADLTVSVAGDLVSRPYVDLTCQAMEAFGAPVQRDGYSRFSVPAGGYRPRDYEVEADASSASYFFAAAAVTRGRVRVTGIPADSRQGDLGFLDLVERMGCRVERDAGGITVTGGPLRGIEASMSDCPDVAPTLAAVALFAEGPTSIAGIGHLRVKETDRIETVAAGLRALGAVAETGPDSLVIRPPAPGRGGLRGGTIDPSGDHRIAMAFAVAGLGLTEGEGVEIADPDCVGKSFPGFFEALDSLAGA